MSATIIRHPLLKDSPIPVCKEDEFRRHILSELDRPWHERMGQVPLRLADKIRLLEENDRHRSRMLDDFLDHWLGIIESAPIELPNLSCEVTETKFLELAGIGRTENFRGYHIEPEVLQKPGADAVRLGRPFGVAHLQGLCLGSP